MPTYQYICEKCQQRFEVFLLSMNDSKVVCEVCGAEREHLKKQLVPSAFYFKDKDGLPDTSHRGRR